MISQLVTLDERLCVIFEEKKLQQKIIALLIISDKRFRKRARKLLPIADPIEEPWRMVIDESQNEARYGDDMASKFEPEMLEKYGRAEFRELELSKQDVQLAILWAAVKCSLWSCSLDADPLILRL